MNIICQKCMKMHNVYSVLDKEDNVVSSNDKYIYPIFVNEKEYIGIKCECGAINIAQKD